MIRTFALALFVAAITAISASSVSAADNNNKVKAQYGRVEPGTKGIDTVLATLNQTHTNSFNFLIDGHNGDSYLTFVQFLQRLKLTNSTLTVWVTLIPPTETRDGSCSIPADSPLTPFNETSYFDMTLGYSGCNDYLAWALVLAKLKRELFSHLRYVNIDDFVDNIHHGRFHEDYVSEIVQRLHAAPDLKFVPTTYSTVGSKDFTLSRWPWLTKLLDGCLFYFRNDLEGNNNCAIGCNTTPPATCHASCLWGPCAERSLVNFQSELHHFVKALEGRPAETEIFIGIYFSAYHGCTALGGPSVNYDFSLLKMALDARHVRGTMVYTTQTPPSTGCPAGSELRNKGCAVQYLYK